MPQVVLTLTKLEIDKMKANYSNQLKTPPAGAVFAAKTPSCSITAYQSGKVLFQGKTPEAEAGKWGETASNSPRKKTKRSLSAHTYAPPEGLFTSSHIGSDEAGTGDYFGPVTVAAAFVSEDNISLLKALGVKDSKNLTDDKIQAIAKELVNHKIPYSLVILHNEKYNRLQSKGWSQGKMKTMLHHHAITKLAQKISPVKPTGVLIDQFSEPSVYLKHLASEKAELQENVYFMTKAESYSIAVAAGSIIARASFVKEMDKLSVKAGLSLPKGASQKVDQTAAEIIKTTGKQALNQLAKTHFANTQKAEAYLK